VARPTAAEGTTLDLTGVPPWLGTAVIGAIGTVLGFFGRSALRWWNRRQRERAARRSRLQRLASLLQESGSIFRVQNALARRLLEMVAARAPSANADKKGFETTFAAAYPQMAAEERELHTIIRGVTETSMLRVNTGMAEWLRTDTVFKVLDGAQSAAGVRLREELLKLEIHLSTWHAKYPVWIPGHPEHALVYMDDEEAHGKGFPPDVEPAVAAMLAER
jgi:hypothetical protein